VKVKVWSILDGKIKAIGLFDMEFKDVPQEGGAFMFEGKTKYRIIDRQHLISKKKIISVELFAKEEA
jgi:hypothetical protein